MEFVLQKQEQETRRMKIEATGVAQYQEIVAKGIDENLLRWKGIEATKQLAASANTKIVVIGGGKDGLPIILNTADGGTSKTVAAAASHATPALRGRRQSTRRAVTALTNLEN
jgi:regulator of protease activity HflC (stomatin/prohibitin superfamily)